MQTGFEIRFTRANYRDGQVLSSRDLRQDRVTEERLWSLHQRYVHQTWGVVTGLDVDVASGGHGVTLNPGYAISAEGRNIVIRHKSDFPAPKGNGVFLFVVAHSAENGWRPAVGWQPDDEVPLARATVSGGFVGALDTGIRRLARALARPRIGSGVTTAKGTGWVNGAQWIEATVDTSETGFVKPPQYIARVSRSLPSFIAASGNESLTVRVLNAPEPFGSSLNAVQAENLGLTISWFGIESGEAS